MRIFGNFEYFICKTEWKVLKIFMNLGIFKNLNGLGVRLKKELWSYEIFNGSGVRLSRDFWSYEILNGLVVRLNKDFRIWMT